MWYIMEIFGSYTLSGNHPEVQLNKFFVYKTACHQNNQLKTWLYMDGCKPDISIALPFQDLRHAMRAESCALMFPHCSTL